MKKSILAFYMFFVFTASAQDDKVHLISLESENNIAIDSGFYIDSIYDGRQVKESIGTVYKLFKEKVPANFKKPFIDELRSLFTVLYPKNETKKPISVRINELYITETSANTDTRRKELASATVVLDIIEKGVDGKEYILGTYFSTREDTKSDVTKLHPALIIAAIKNTFENYRNSKQVYQSPIPFDQEEPINIKNSKITEGVYLNYKDVFNQHALSLDNYSINKYKEGFCLTNKRTGRVETAFYGFSDGQNFYINLFQFSTVRYYLKTEIMNDLYFIDEVYESNLDFGGYYATYGGMIGGAGGALAMNLMYNGDNSSELKKIPLILERFNGTPTFLSDKYMLRILESNKELLKEYKKTQRTPVDKKFYYKRMFGIKKAPHLRGLFYLLGLIKNAFGYFFFKAFKFFSASILVLKLPTHTLYMGVLKTIVASISLFSFLKSVNVFFEFSLSPLNI